MSLYERLRRVYIAIEVLRGRRDDPVAELEQTLRTEHALRNMLDRMQDERQYWYQLWFQHSKEYHNAQSQVLSEIDELRRKLGVEGADKLHELEQRAEQQRHSRLVEPKHHPVAGIKTPLKSIEVPSKSAAPAPEPPPNRNGSVPPKSKGTEPTPIKGTVRKATPKPPATQKSVQRRAKAATKARKRG